MSLFRSSFQTGRLCSVMPYKHLCKLFILLMSLIPCVRGQVCTPSPASGVGVAVFSNGPYAYVIGDDNHLWLNWMSGGHWGWTDVDTPPGTTVSAGLGVLNVANFPYVFVQGQGVNGHIWMYQAPSQPNWLDLGVPPGMTTIKTGVGVLTFNNIFYIFVQGMDNHLWVRSGSGSTWSSWTKPGTPNDHKILSGVGVLTLTNGPYVFVQGIDHHLWMTSMASSWNWLDLGVPNNGTATTVTAGLGAVNNSNIPYAFVQGSDGHLWANSYAPNTNNWTWSDQGVPEAGKSVTGAIGVLPEPSTYPSVFVLGSDGHLWTNWKNVNTMTWSDLSVPAPGKKVSSGVGVTSGNSHRVADDYVFVLGNDGFLWMNWFSGSSWSWVDQSALVVNMIPLTMSGETNQDSEPFLSVYPSSGNNMVGSAFTPNPTADSVTAPIYISNNCGKTWSLNNIVPSDDPRTGTGDITHAYSSNFYSGILKKQPGASHLLAELKSTNPYGPDVMVVQDPRPDADQPFVRATTVGGNDYIYVGNNDLTVSPRSATVDVSLDGGTNYNSSRLDPRTGTDPHDGPSIRISMALDNTIYAAYFEWTAFTGTMITANVVVVRDDNGATGNTPFTSLIGADGLSGAFAATNRQIPWTDSSGPLGQQRIGSTLSLAVDPNNSSTVYVAWADRVGNNDIYTIHVSQSRNRGVTWSQDLRTITNATNPELAVAANGTATSNGTVGLLYQQFTNGNWVTQLEQTKDGFATISDTVLATTPANSPVVDFQPYLGDYNCLLAVGSEFRGIFSANNTPDLANFPQGVLYQRNANFTTHTLLNGKNSVSVSIDPFFFTVPVLH